MTLPPNYHSMSIEEKNLSVRTILNQGLHQITFTKIDESERTMTGTLDKNIVPPTIIKEDKPLREHKPETLSVWCTDANSWRSFRIDNLISIQEHNAIPNQKSN